MATDSRKRLALAILDFLSTSLKDGTLQPEDSESIEIASNCIAEAFHVDPTDTAAVQDALGGQNLLSIYGVYEKLKGRGSSTSSGASATAAAASAAAAAASGSAGPDAAKAAAENPKGGPTEASEKLKGTGNAAMQRKDYAGAVESYTAALEISPLNAIYLSNRAAAYSAMGQHEFAKNDAELATATDPRYTKAWSRLGLARFALGDAQGAVDAYQQGIDAEGNGGSEAMKKGLETARRKVEAERAAQGAEAGDDDEVETARGGAGAGGMPDLGSLASMFGGGGGGGGAGGMPDLGAIMQNPMMRQMAQNLMSNPEMMNNIMSNPQLREMAGRFGGGGGGGGSGGGSGGGGGGMPNFQEMMNDPAIAEMARSFMGGMGGAGRGAGGQ